jgi:hypothetical protein
MAHMARYDDGHRGMTGREPLCATIIETIAGMLRVHLERRERLEAEADQPDAG